MEIVGVGDTVPKQLLHFCDPLTDIVTKIGSSLPTLLLTLPDFLVISGLADAAVLAFVDFEVELHVKILEEGVELLDLSLVVITQFLLRDLGFWVVHGLLYRVLLASL